MRSDCTYLYASSMFYVLLGNYGVLYNVLYVLYVPYSTPYGGTVLIQHLCAVLSNAQVRGSSICTLPDFHCRSGLDQLSQLPFPFLSPFPFSALALAPAPPPAPPAPSPLSLLPVPLPAPPPPAPPPTSFCASNVKIHAVSFRCEEGHPVLQERTTIDSSKQVLLPPRNPTKARREGVAPQPSMM